MNLRIPGRQMISACAADARTELHVAPHTRDERKPDKKNNDRDNGH
jgi:hypothetical protein